MQRVGFIAAVGAAAQQDDVAPRGFQGGQLATTHFIGKGSADFTPCGGGGHFCRPHGQFRDDADGRDGQAALGRRGQVDFRTRSAWVYPQLRVDRFEAPAQILRRGGHRGAAQQGARAGVHEHGFGPGGPDVDGNQLGRHERIRRWSMAAARSAAALSRSVSGANTRS